VLLNLFISLLAAEAPASAPATAPKFDAKAIRAKALARTSESDVARPKSTGSTKTDTPASRESAAPESPAHGETKTATQKAPGTPPQGTPAPPAEHAAKEKVPKGTYGIKAPAHRDGHGMQTTADAKDAHGSKHEDTYGKVAASHETPSQEKSNGHGDKAPAHAKSPSHEPETKTRLPACGEIPRSATWKARNVTLNRSLRVPAGMTLWLTPGTELHLGKRDSCQTTPTPVEIIVEGRLVIEGDALRPVRIAPAAGTTEWGGIKITGSASIDHLRLQGGQRGLWFHGGTGNVRSTLLEGCVTAVQVSGGATPTLSHLVITKSQGAGLLVDRASPLVTGTLFLENKGIAAWFSGTGLTRFENNAFWGNLQGNVAGSKRWGNFSGKGIVKHDDAGNLLADPVLVGSMRDNAWRDSLARLSRRPAELPFGEPPWALSGASPLRGKGPRNPSSPWNRTDIGLYGLDQD